MAAVSAQKMSDEKLAAATGRKSADWHALLDAAGARDWKHPVIADWLRDVHGVESWWAQGITVGFEQAIGRRLPGQMADGSFAVSATKTVDGSRESVVKSAVDRLSAQFGKPASVTPGSRYATARWNSSDGTIVAAIAETKPGKTVVSLTWSKIQDGSTLDAAKTQLREALAGLT